MAEFYSENDIKRRIITWAGKCADVKAKNVGESFTDMSPACLGFASTEPLLERMLAVFDPVKSSYRVFNEIHITTGDRNLTIGCGNYANSSLAKMFLAMPDDAWKEFRTYVADQLLASTKYFEQYSQDYVVKGFLGSKNPSELKKADVLAASLEYFFARDLLNGKTYSDIENSSILKKRYQYNGHSWTITDKRKSYLSLWADTSLLLAAIDPKTQKPPQQYNAYKNYSDVHAKIGCTKYVDKVQDKKSSPVCVRLFPGHEMDNGTCEFWFYRILYKALLIKSVANWQHQLWVNDYFDAGVANYTALTASNEAILPGLISWKSSGLTTTEKDDLPFDLGSSPFDYWRNLGDKYYLLSAKEVLVNKTKNAAADKKRQELINTCILKDGELFTALIIWVQFIKTKNKMRNRLRAMWKIYFNVPFQKYKDDKQTTVYISHIKDARLTVSETDSSVILDITQEDKDHKTKKITVTHHSYTFISKPNNP